MNGTWQRTVLADVVEPVKKQDPAASGRSTFRYIDISSVDGEGHKIVGGSEMRASEAPGRARQQVRAHDTVFSTVRPYLEKIAYIDASLDGEIASTGFCVLRPRVGILHPRFLFHYMTSRHLLDQVLPLQRGVSYPAVRDRDVLAATIPLPQWDEQQRIVDILEDHLSRLEAANDYLDAAMRRVRSLGQSAIDRAAWSPGAATVPVASVLREPMRNGFSARASATGSVRVLTLTAVTRRTFTEEFTKLTDASLDRVRGLWLEPGDVLVQRANTPELVGSAALYEGERDWAVFPDLLIRLRTNPAVMTPEFLSLALQSERCHRALRARAKGLAGSMPKIDQGAIAGLAVPCPDVDEQRRIVAHVAAQMKEVDRLSTAALGARRRSEALRRALLTSAFSGRLTGHVSDLERAEELAFA